MTNKVRQFHNTQGQAIYHSRFLPPDSKVYIFLKNIKLKWQYTDFPHWYFILEDEDNKEFLEKMKEYIWFSDEISDWDFEKELHNYMVVTEQEQTLFNILEEELKKELIKDFNDEVISKIKESFFERHKNGK